MKIKTYTSSLVLSALVSINDANILNLIQKNNADLKSLELKTLQSQILYDKTDLNYAPFLNFDLSGGKDNTDTMLSESQQNLETKKYTATLGKNFLSGTQLNIEATQIDSRFGLNPYLPTANFNQNYVAINLQQSLFPNFLGTVDRANLNASSASMQRDQFQVESDKIDLTKLKLADYWKAKILKLQIKKNKDLLVQYESLTKKILQKSKNGLANPGEYEQAEAEIIQRKQNISDDTASLNLAIEQLREDLSINEDSELDISSDVVELQKVATKQINIDSTKKFNLQKLKTLAAEATMTAAVKNNLPDISLYGRYTQQGLEDSQSDSMNEFNQANKNKYIIGLKLNYTFGSDINELNYKLQKQQYEIENQKYKTLNADVTNYFNSLISKLDSSYKNIETAKQVLKLRNDITQKIRKNYEQGRSDVSLLITAYSNAVLAEINLLNAEATYAQLVYEYEAQIK